MQRPGPAINLTIEEANDYREGEDNIKYVLSRTHKTARSLGPARLAMEPITFDVFRRYMKIVHPQIATSSNINNALVTGNYTQYLYHIRSLAREYGIEKLPSGRQWQCPYFQRTKWKQSPTTWDTHHLHQRYYRSRQKKNEVTSAFNVMSTFMSKCLCILLLLYTILPCREI